MDAVKYLKERRRMCKNFDNCSEGCPLNRRYENSLCSIHIDDGYEEIVEIVEKWSKENPQKTILQDFLEKYPNATLSSKGVPIYCALHLGYLDKCEEICSDCWNRSLEG